MEDRVLVTRVGMHSASEVLAAVNQSVQELIALGVTDGRTGGYFCLMEFESGEMLIPPTMVGEVANGKDDQYIRNCKEKATRLSLIRQLSIAVGMKMWDFSRFPGWTSFELRDEKRKQWGGAITTAIKEGPTYIFSISGFPEEVDEASMISTAVRLEVLNFDLATTLAGRIPHSSEGNQIIYRHLRADGTFIVS